MNITYYLVSDKQAADGSALYGIAAIGDNHHVIVEARCLSGDKEKVAALVTLCNALKLSSIHFDDVIADFIG